MYFTCERDMNFGRLRGIYFQVVQVVKNLPARAGDARDTGSSPVWGRSPREENGNPFPYSCLENPTDRGAWPAIVPGVIKGRTRLSNLNNNM